MTGCSYKALLEAVSPSASELDQMLFPTERWPPDCEVASRPQTLGLGCASDVTVTAIFLSAFSFQFHSPAFFANALPDQKVSGFIALSETGHYVQKELAPDRRWE